MDTYPTGWARNRQNSGVQCLECTDNRYVPAVLGCFLTDVDNIRLDLGKSIEGYLELHHWIFSLVCEVLV